MRYRDPSSRVLVRDLTPRRIERIEAQAFERDYARSRHNMSAPDMVGSVEPTVPAPWNTVGLTAAKAHASDSGGAA